MNEEYETEGFLLSGSEPYDELDEPESDEVEKELEEFLALNFFERFGGGIGLTRLARAYEMLLESKKELQLEDFFVEFSQKTVNRPY